MSETGIEFDLSREAAAGLILSDLSYALRLVAKRPDDGYARGQVSALLSAAFFVTDVPHANLPTLAKMHQQRIDGSSSYRSEDWVQLLKEIPFAVPESGSEVLGGGSGDG
jgi:hypothetical protein